MVQLPLIAAIKGSEPHLPISLVSISAAESTVTCASHDSALRHYKYTGPGSPNGTSEELSEALAAQMQASQPARQRVNATESGRHLGNEETCCVSSACDSMAINTAADYSKQQTGQHTPCAQSLGALDIAEIEAWPSIKHRQRTDHDRHKGEEELLTAPDTGRARRKGQADKPPPRELARRDASAAGNCARLDPTWQALEEISTEAVSALTVIESNLHFKAENGSSEQLLSGFQVGPKSCIAHTIFF